MANNQAYRTQQELAQEMMQSLFNRHKEVEYVDRRIRDLLEMLWKVGMFSEIIEALEIIYKNDFLPLKEELIIGMLEDIKYVQKQEEALGNILKIIR